MPITNLKTPSSKGFTYFLGGLRLTSDIPLFGLETIGADSAQQAEISVRIGPILGWPASPTKTFCLDQYTVSYSGEDILIDITSVARFLLLKGNEIIVESARGSDDGEVRAYLLGTVFALICHQRGIIPLHASAIDVASGCVVFVGNSGAGKSTLAAALARRGHSVIADDVCFQRLDSNGSIQSWPGVGRIRLWEDALHALNCTGPGLEREVRGYQKYFLPVRGRRNPNESRRLCRVYQLSPALGRDIELTHLLGAAALEVLMQNVYRLALAERLGYKPNAFTLCAAVARDVQVFRFSRPWGLDALDRSMDVLENHLEDLVA